jgi:hypothetical protein
MTSSSLANIRHVASQTTDTLDSIVFPTLPTDYRVVKGPLLDLRVQEAVKYVLQKLGIKTRDEFLVWRGENGGPKGLLIHSPFYGMIEDISPTHWNTLMYPTAGCRAAYERILPGYKIHSA